MNLRNVNGHDYYGLIAVACIMSLLLPYWAPSSFAESGTPSLPPAEKLRLGEEMYREGLLPSGEPLQALVKGDLPVPGTAFTCVSCHLRSGIGSVEGGVVTPATTGRILFQPLEMLYKGVRQDPKYFPVPPRRPAYTDETLAEALQWGVDPAGRIMNDVMPRYLLEKEDMAIMISYLKSLSSAFSPGVSETAMHFATVITDDVTTEDREAMLAPLEKYLKIKNDQAKLFENPRAVKSRLMAEKMMTSKELAVRTLSLARWTLRGAPETWRSQLEEYNRREPVFALLGGMTNGTWQPIHQFSEDNHIPCLFPMTNFPVISHSDWYTLYLSKGYYQEGEGAARHLNDRGDLLKGKPVVQIVRASNEGRALATGFQETWHDLGHQEPVTVTVQAGQDVGRDFLQRVLAKERPAALILWDGSASLPALEILAAAENRPAMVFVSSSYLGKSIWSLKEQLRDFTFITYPYRLPQLPQENVKPAMGKKVFSADATQIANQTYSLTEVLTMALMDMKGNYYRDNFLDVIGMVMDLETPLYERISFGPGQRYASKGCYIVQLSKGPKPELVRKSEWVIH